MSRLATVGVASAASLGMIPTVRPGIEHIRRRFGRSQFLITSFALWIVVSYVTARSQDQAFFAFNEYIKIFAMMAAAMALIYTVDQLYWLAAQSAFVLGYIALEVNDLYLRQGYLGIYRVGYGGLDNNGAGLMLAMGLPICILLWDQIRSRWRWFFLAFAPLILHAVLMTYSRGAMLALLVTGPLVAFRCQRRLQMAVLAAVLVCGAIPIMAGPEIRERFLTLKENELDESANARRKRVGGPPGIWQWITQSLGVGILVTLICFPFSGLRADMEGRTIHSQYLQIAADNGFVGMGLYLAVLASVWADTRYCRLAVKGRCDLWSRRVYLVAAGIETSLAVFCCGGAFLSLEIFELPYLLLLLGSQLAAIVKGQLEVERASQGLETMERGRPGLGTHPAVRAF